MWHIYFHISYATDTNDQTILGQIGISKKFCQNIGMQCPITIGYRQTTISMIFINTIQNPS